MHRQLAQQLRQAIAGGGYPPGGRPPAAPPPPPAPPLSAVAGGGSRRGDRLPTEPQLATRHAVSRITARQAVMQLVREGLVVRRQGKGRYVADPPGDHARA